MLMVRSPFCNVCRITQLPFWRRCSYVTHERISTAKSSTAKAYTVRWVVIKGPPSIVIDLSW